MRLLLDTHVWIWGALSPHRIRPETLEAMTTSAEVFVSAVVALEVAVKQGLHKLDPNPVLLESPSSRSLTVLGVTWAHAIEVGRLPRHHRDPFDRLLIAQARVEGLTIVTADRLFDSYDVPTLAA